MNTVLCLVGIFASCIIIICFIGMVMKSFFRHMHDDPVTCRCGRTKADTNCQPWFDRDNAGAVADRLSTQCSRCSRVGTSEPRASEPRAGSSSPRPWDALPVTEPTDVRG